MNVAKRKNKLDKTGFTLVELLAVVVILGIISLIAVPIVLNTINDLNKKTIQISAQNYIQSVKLSIVNKLLDGVEILDGIYTVTDDGNITDGEKTYYVDIDGETPLVKDSRILIENKDVSKYALNYESYFVTKYDVYTKKEISSWISVEDFGAKGYGVTDDTASIKKAVNYINENGGTLYFPLGYYNVSVDENKQSVMEFSSNKKITLELLGSEIILAKNKFSYYNVIYVKNCKDFTIKNGYIKGDRIDHDYTTIKGTHEFGYGIYSYYSEKVIIDNMNISHMTGDAIINKAGTPEGNTNSTIIKNSELSYCRRQGISVLDTDFIEISNVDIHNIGTFDGIKGTSPMSGIDIEPASGTKIVDSIVIDKVNIKDITRFGIVGGSLTNKFKISNSYIENYRGTKATINDCEFNILLDDNTAISKSVIKNSYIKFKAKNRTMFLSNSTVDNTTIEGVLEKESYEGNRLSINDTTILTNSTIKDFRGDPDNLNANVVYAGINLRGEYALNSSNKNNIYLNSKFVIDTSQSENNVFGDSNSIIKDSILIMTGNNPLDFNNIKFYNAKPKVSSSKLNINFNNCEINYIDIFNLSPGKFTLNNTKIIKNGVEKDTF